MLKRNGRDDGARTRDLRRDRPRARQRPRRISFPFQLVARIVKRRFRAATPRATVFDDHFMPDLAYNGGCARSAGTTAQADLACRLAPSADGLSADGSQEARFRAVSIANRSEA